MNNYFRGHRTIDRGHRTIDRGQRTMIVDIIENGKWRMEN